MILQPPYYKSSIKTNNAGQYNVLLTNQVCYTRVKHMDWSLVYNSIQ